MVSKNGNFCHLYSASLLIILFFVDFTKPVQLISDIPTNTISKTSDLNVCVKPDRRSSEIVNCFSGQVLRQLQDLEESEEFKLADGFTLKRDEAGPRDISNFLDKDPMDYRSIIEGASSLISRRAVQWDWSFVYPGLTMRIGPTLNAESVLEFVMDPRVRDRDVDTGETGTARLVTKQLLVPFLLGFKFQLSTLLPLLFGILVILSKKALILAKIAVVAASVFGFQSLASNGGYSGGYGGHSGYNGAGLNVYGNRYQPDYFYKSDQQPQPTEDHVDPYYGQRHHQQSERVTPEELRDRLERLFVNQRNQDRNNVRNFAWND